MHGGMGGGETHALAVDGTTDSHRNRPQSDGFLLTPARNADVDASLGGSVRVNAPSRTQRRARCEGDHGQVGS